VEDRLILLLDCSHGQVPIDAERANTAWSGGSGKLEIADDLECIVFFDSAQYQGATAAHVADGRRIRERIERGLIFIAISNAGIAHRHQNLLNMPIEVHIDNRHQPATNLVLDETEFWEFLSHHSHRIAVAPAVSIPDGVVIARHTSTNQPVAQMLRLGAGLIVILPDLGDPNAYLAELITLARSLVAVPPEDWLDTADYWMPQLAELHEDRHTLTVEYERQIREFAKQINAVEASIQQPINELLTATGSALVDSVARAFDLLGVSTIVVDQQYPERPREEDLWLSGTPVRQPESEVRRLGEVKGYRRSTCSDDDYGALTKYLIRRGRQWRRSDLGGLLVINHMSQMPATRRPSAFSTTQISDAERDGIALVSTLTIFRYVQAVYAGRLAKADVASRLLDSIGLVTPPP
jgi:hypothetical protein